MYDDAYVCVDVYRECLYVHSYKPMIILLSFKKVSFTHIWNARNDIYASFAVYIDSNPATE